MTRYSLPLWQSKLYLTVDLNAFIKTVVSAVNDGHTLDDIARDWPPQLIAAVRQLMTPPDKAKLPSRR